MDDLRIYDIHTASALLTHGTPYMGVKNDIEGKYFFVFAHSTDILNAITLYQKQHDRLVLDLEKYKIKNGRYVRAKVKKFGGAKAAFIESTKRIKGAATTKTSGVLK